MGISVRILKLIIVFILFPEVMFTQNFKEYSQGDFDALRIEPDTYDFWWDKDECTYFINKDSIPYFVKIKDYKGIVNYGYEPVSYDRRIVNYIEDVIMYNMSVTIESCVFDVDTHKIRIKGKVTSNRNWKGVPDHIKILIGERADTTSKVYVENHVFKDREYGTYKGERFDGELILDSLASFYFPKLSLFTKGKSNENRFEIESEINTNSILVFGLCSAFAEIFDIGAMVFSDNKQKTKDIKPVKSTEPITIIRKNIAVLWQTPEVVIVPDYYQLVNKAEDFIQGQQYALAKQEYNTFINTNQYVFARDIHNAIRAAVLSRDYKNAIVWSKKMIAKGVELPYFDAPTFNILKKQPEWRGFIKDYDSLHQGFLKTRDTILIDRLNSIVDLDQQYYQGRAQGKVSNDAAMDITETNDINLLNLIKERGFPTEEKIGVHIANNTIEVNPRYYVLIYHSNQASSPSWPVLSEIRQSAYSKNVYDAYRDGLDIITKNGQSCFAIYKGNLYIEKGCNIDALQKPLKQLRFRFNNPNDFIVSYNDFINFPYEQENDEANDSFMEERYDFVEKLTDDWLWYEK